mgnify:CR=1 FL=1
MFERDHSVSKYLGNIQSLFIVLGRFVKTGQIHFEIFTWMTHYIKLKAWKEQINYVQFEN